MGGWAERKSCLREVDSPAHRGPKRRSQGNKRPIFSSSCILPLAPFGSPVIVIRAGQPARAKHRWRRVQCIWRGGWGMCRTGGHKAEKEALVSSLLGEMGDVGFALYKY